MWSRAWLARSGGFIPQSISVRGKHGIWPHGKPRWMPIAKSKEFQLKLVDHTPKEELRAMEDLLKEYHVHLSATSHHLYKEYLQSSDVGEAAQKEALRAQEEHENLVRENEAENQRVRELREQRLKREFDQRDEQIRGEVSQAKEDEAERVREADQIVKETEAILAHRIDRKDFEGALLEALDHPVDHEYAIDLEGHIYRGRYTKSLSVPAEKREKIPSPANADDILGLFKERSQSSSQN